MNTILPNQSFREKIVNTPNRSLLLISLSLLILNIIFILIISSRTGVTNLDGSYSAPNSTAVMVSAFMGIIFTLTFLTLFISFITARFVNKGQPFKQRFIKGYLLTFIVLSTITALRFGYLILF